MSHRFRLLSYLACTAIAFLTLGSAPRCPTTQTRDLVIAREVAGDGDGGSE